MYPIQDGEDIPEWLAKLVYQGYVNRYGDVLSYERMRERGGFGKAEVVRLLNCLDIKTIEDADRAVEATENEVVIDDSLPPGYEEDGGDTRLNRLGRFE